MFIHMVTSNGSSLGFYDEDIQGALLFRSLCTSPVNFDYGEVLYQVYSFFAPCNQNQRLKLPSRSLLVPGFRLRAPGSGPPYGHRSPVGHHFMLEGIYEMCYSMPLSYTKEMIALNSLTCYIHRFLAPLSFVSPSWQCSGSLVVGFGFH